MGRAFFLVMRHFVILPMRMAYSLMLEAPYIIFLSMICDGSRKHFIQIKNSNIHTQRAGSARLKKLDFMRRLQLFFLSKKLIVAVFFLYNSSLESPSFEELYTARRSQEMPIFI